MRFLVVTLAPTMLKEDGHFYSYAPYVKEMDLWFSAVDSVAILSPTSYDEVLLLAPFKRKDIDVQSVPTLAFNSFGKAAVSILVLPYIFLKLFREFSKADHIHLRCPGNMGLLGALVQIFFPKKTKTAKYAGNWDPNAKQPSSYRFQKWLLNNTLLTKNMQVLVYGEWPKQSKNIRSFFTATYPKSKMLETVSRSVKQPFRFLFVGMLSSGKHPLYALKLVEDLYKSGVACTFNFYGDGEERAALENYVSSNNLEEIVFLHGNQSAETIEQVYKSSDFLILPSQSEGWPKVVAEAMFWGVIPIVSKVSCVPWMLDQGKRGALLSMDFLKDTQMLKKLVADDEELAKMSNKAMAWSQQYTLDDFERELKLLVQ